MDKLTRYKRNKIRKALDYNINILKSRVNVYSIQELEYIKKLSYRNFPNIKNKILSLKRLPQKPYITNLDVCNVD